MNETEKKDSLLTHWRIRPGFLGFFILVLGLLMDKWWWQIGATILLILFIEAYFRYRTMD